MNERKWSEELLNDMEIPVSMMPSRLVNSTEIVGKLTDSAALDLGLLPGTPVFFGGVDCGAATVGMGVLESGVFAATIGTSMCGALICDKSNLAAESGKLIAWPYQYEPLEYSYLFSGANTAGAILKWFRNTFAENEFLTEKSGGKNAYDQLNEMAQEIPLGSNGLVVLPYFMGERAPIWNSDAKGVIFGLSLSHTKAHIYRAFLEAIAFSLRDSIEASGNYQNDHILVSGGVTRSSLFRQIVADVTGYIVYSPNEDVEANLGDVMLAAIGTGLLEQDEVSKWQVMSNKTEPIKENHEEYEKFYRLYHEIYDCLKVPMADLSSLV
jgi:xylulokinase